MYVELVAFDKEQQEVERSLKLRKPDFVIILVGSLLHRQCFFRKTKIVFRDELNARPGCLSLPIINSLKALIYKYLAINMKKIYHSSTCTTNQRILKELKPGKDFILQDIKTEPITAKQLDEMKKLAGSYEALFSRVAIKYRSLGLNEMDLKEKDYKKYILEEYTFLKRPVIIVNDQIFIGNAPKNVAAAKAAMK